MALPQNVSDLWSECDAPRLAVDLLSNGIAGDQLLRQNRLLTPHKEYGMKA